MSAARLLELSADGSEQVNLGRFFIDGRGEATFTPVNEEDGYMFLRILRRRMHDPETKGVLLISAEVAPQEWIRALPFNITGAYLRAELES